MDLFAKPKPVDADA